MPSLDEALGAAEDMLDVDLSGAVEFTNAPAGGPYVAEVTKVTTKNSKAGDRFIQFYGKVVEGEHVGMQIPITWASLVVGGKSGNLHTGTLKTWLRAMGFDVDTDRIKVSPKAIVGRRLVVRIVEDGEYTRTDVVGPVPTKSALS